MKKCVIICAFIMSAVPVRAAGIELLEIESVGIIALTNSDFLCGLTFSNALASATNSTDPRVCAAANILVGIRARSAFFKTADDTYLHEEAFAISNALVSTGALTNDWTRELAILLHAGSLSSANEFIKSYEVLTNELNVIANAGSIESTNILLNAILAKFEMPGISLPIAYKVMAGMSAAKLDKKTEALHFANQVPERYSNLIKEFADIEK